MRTLLQQRRPKKVAKASPTTRHEKLQKSRDSLLKKPKPQPRKPLDIISYSET